MEAARAGIEGAGAASDAALLAAIVARDQQAFAALYDRYGRLVYRRAYHLLGERGAAEDVVQEVFLRVWRRATTFDPARGTVRAWLVASAQHAALDMLRGSQGRALRELPLFALASTAAADGPDDVAETRLEASLVRRAMTSLPPPQREVLELAYFEGLSVQEIAARTAAALGTVKGRMLLGRAKLRSALTPTFAQ
jgi:RNA polymerase sigma-70 factor (ECF subfamily)